MVAGNEVGVVVAVDVLDLDLGGRGRHRVRLVGLEAAVAVALDDGHAAGVVLGDRDDVFLAVTVKVHASHIHRRVAGVGARAGRVGSVTVVQLYGDHAPSADAPDGDDVLQTVAVEVRDR